MHMTLLISVLSAVMAAVAVSLVSANLFVLVSTALHKRKFAMKVLAPFSRAVMLLRLSDSINPSKPYRPISRRKHIKH